MKRLFGSESKSKDDFALNNRREKTLAILEKMDIDYCNGLPVVEDMAMTKSLSDICRRAVVSLYISVWADYYLNDKAELNDEKGILMNRMKELDSSSALFPSEKALIEGSISDKDALQLTWGVECCYMLMWVLGFVETSEVIDACDECDPLIIIRILNSFDSLNDMIGKCKMREQSQILDMLDLYYNYHWVCVDKSVRPEAKCGELIGGVVMERRKALEWLFDKENDWSEISLDT